MRAYARRRSHARCRTAVASAIAACLVVVGVTVQAQAAEGTDGHAAYIDAGCAACHQADAGGTPGLYPRLAGRIATIAQSETGRRYLVDVVTFGMMGTIDVDGQSITGLMPPHGELSDDNAAAMLTWLADLKRPSGVAPEKFTAAFVHQVRQTKLSPDEVLQLRAKAVPKQ